jgi:hypothetical protein
LFAVADREFILYRKAWKVNNFFQLFLRDRNWFLFAVADREFILYGKWVYVNNFFLWVIKNLRLGLPERRFSGRKISSGLSLESWIFLSIKSYIHSNA